jgi:hypothetical protein
MIALTSGSKRAGGNLKQEDCLHQAQDETLNKKKVEDGSQNLKHFITCPSLKSKNIQKRKIRDLGFRNQLRNPKPGLGPETRFGARSPKEEEDSLHRVQDETLNKKNHFLSLRTAPRP